jgi:hypothetical protein
VNEKRTDLATPQLVAIINGYEDLVDLLLDKGADPNAEGGSTLLTVQGMRARPQKIVVQIGRPMERRRTIALGRVDIGVFLQQRQNRLPVAALYRIRDRSVLGSGDTQAGTHEHHIREHRG